MHKIVYLQANENVAASFQEEFLKQDIEMLIVKSGEEALDIIAKEKVLLLLLDINIPDMRFRKLVDRIRAISPQVIINVCVDVLDPLMITKLSNRHHVHKIYVAPWDVDLIIEEVKESIEIAIINEQINVREEKISSEIEDLKSTLESLKTTLKKQQYSYSQFVELTDCFTAALSTDFSEESNQDNKLAFAKDIYTAILRMQTTGAFDIDKFEEDIRKDLREIKGIAKGYATGEVESCLFAGQSRAFAQNIRFCVFMVARLYAEFYDKFTLNVFSHYITTKEAEFTIEIVTDDAIRYGKDEAFSEYASFVEKIIDSMTVNYSVRSGEKSTNYCCTFQVARE